MAVDKNGKAIDLVADFIEQEYLSFPVGRHDDMLDSLARIAEPNLDLAWPMKTTQAVNRYVNYAPLDSIIGY